MLQTLWAVIREGKIEPLEDVKLPDGMQVLVTLLPDNDERSFWQSASESALTDVWDNQEDNIYAVLLQK